MSVLALHCGAQAAQAVLAVPRVALTGAAFAAAALAGAALLADSGASAFRAVGALASGWIHPLGQGREPLSQRDDKSMRLRLGYGLHSVPSSRILGQEAATWPHGGLRAKRSWPLRCQSPRHLPLLCSTRLWPPSLQTQELRTQVWPKLQSGWLRRCGRREPERSKEARILHAKSSVNAAGPPSRATLGKSQECQDLQPLALLTKAKHGAWLRPRGWELGASANAEQNG